MFVLKPSLILVDHARNVGYRIRFVSLFIIVKAAVLGNVPTAKSAMFSIST